MEWTYAERQPGQSLFAFFADQINHDDEERRFELLALSHVMRGVCYGAYRSVNKKSGEDRISGLIIPVQMQRRDRRIGYRVTTEYDGSLDHHRCPWRIYALLSRFRHCEEYAHAREWRRRVEAWNRHATTASPLKAGAKIVFKKPVKFDNGDEHADFIVESLRPLLLRGHNDALYRIVNLRDRLARGDAMVYA